MAKSLVIVESKAKVKTINRVLGKGYIVKASNGHVQDLPKKELGIDIDNGFEPKYVTIRGKGKILKELKAAAKSAETVFLASDFDREGEAIAWHVANYIGNDDSKIKRIVFNEITERAIKNAIENPGPIDTNKVNAQQARRVLDRLVGYKVSPILWKTIYRGLSAGRVQSVALRLICEREDEIRAFVPREYYTIEAEFRTSDGDEFLAKLFKIDGKRIEIGSKDEAEEIVEKADPLDYRISDVQTKTSKRAPYPPYITSTLQRDAANRLGFSAKKTMQIAQTLYEGLSMGEKDTVGLITYMRTDSTRIAGEALDEARSYIQSNVGSEYLPGKAQVYRSKKGAQDAHEAIRPTSVVRTPEDIKKYLSKDQLRLYGLIWQRFLASQMKPMVFDTTSVDVQGNGLIFRAVGSTTVFDGWTKIYPLAAGRKDSELPVLEKDQKVELVRVESIQHFTKPPPRYTEATLVKELEAKGIGRPSTYAVIIDTLRARKYVTSQKKQFAPTSLGETVWSILKSCFSGIFDVEFTARMEEDLDRIESGQDDWREVIEEFYDPFSKNLGEVKDKVGELKASLEKDSDIVCEVCGKPMIEKWGRMGKFLACTGFPECKSTRPLPGQEPEKLEMDCPECGSELKIRRGRFGRFIGCSKYPECKFTTALTTGVSCPQEDCDGELVEKTSKKGKVFYGCTNYPKCKFVSWDKPLAQTCPDCGSPYIVSKKKDDEEIRVCPACGTKIEEASEAESSGDSSSDRRSRNSARRPGLRKKRGANRGTKKGANRGAKKGRRGSSSAGRGKAKKQS
jgi:DNA topoisomerase-1